MSRTRETLIWHRTCGLCMDQTSHVTRLDSDVTLVEKIYRSASIAVNKYSFLPRQICTLCLQELQQPSSEFRVQCLDAVQLLKSYVPIALNRTSKPPRHFPRELPESFTRLSFSLNARYYRSQCERYERGELPYPPMLPRVQLFQVRQQRYLPAPPSPGLGLWVDGRGDDDDNPCDDMCLGDAVTDGEDDDVDVLGDDDIKTELKDNLLLSKIGQENEILNCTGANGMSGYSRELTQRDIIPETKDRVSTSSVDKEKFLTSMEDKGVAVVWNKNMRDAKGKKISKVKFLRSRQKISNANEHVENDPPVVNSNDERLAEEVRDWLVKEAGRFIGLDNDTETAILKGGEDVLKEDILGFVDKEAESHVPFNHSVDEHIGMYFAYDEGNNLKLEDPSSQKNPVEVIGEENDLWEDVDIVDSIPGQHLQMILNSIPAVKIEEQHSGWEEGWCDVTQRLNQDKGVDECSSKADEEQSEYVQHGIQIIDENSPERDSAVAEDVAIPSCSFAVEPVGSRDLEVKLVQICDDIESTSDSDKLVINESAGEVEESQTNEDAAEYEPNDEYQYSSDGSDLMGFVNFLGDNQDPGFIVVNGVEVNPVDLGACKIEMVSEDDVTHDGMPVAEVKQEAPEREVNPARRRRETYRCDVCKKTVSTRSSLIRHLSGHARRSDLLRRERYACDQCDHTYLKKAHLTRHRAVHAGRYGCHQCRAQSASLNEHVAHLEWHKAQARAFKCDKCDRSYACAAHLKRHLLKHSGIRPYQCPQCPKNYTRSDQLISHSRLHAKFAPYYCYECQKRFNRSDQYQLHVRRHNGEKPFQCSSCAMAFCQKSDLNRHRKNRHDDRTDRKRLGKQGNAVSKLAAKDRVEGVEEGSGKTRGDEEEEHKKRQGGKEEGSKKRQEDKVSTYKKTPGEGENGSKKRQGDKEDGSKKRQEDKEDVSKKKHGEGENSSKKRQGNKEEGYKKRQGDKDDGSKKREGDKEDGSKKTHGEGETRSKKRHGDKDDSSKKRHGDKEDGSKKRQEDKEDGSKKRHGDKEDGFKKRQGDKEGTYKKTPGDKEDDKAGVTTENIVRNMFVVKEDCFEKRGDNGDEHKEREGEKKKRKRRRSKKSKTESKLGEEDMQGEVDEDDKREGEKDEVVKTIKVEDDYVKKREEDRKREKREKKKKKRERRKDKAVSKDEAHNERELDKEDESKEREGKLKHVAENMVEVEDVYDKKKDGEKKKRKKKSKKDKSLKSKIGNTVEGAEERQSKKQNAAETMLGNYDVIDKNKLVVQAVIHTDNSGKSTAASMHAIAMNKLKGDQGGKGNSSKDKQDNYDDIASCSPSFKDDEYKYRRGKKAWLQ